MPEHSGSDSDSDSRRRIGVLLCRIYQRRREVQRQKRTIVVKVDGLALAVAHSLGCWWGLGDLYLGRPQGICSPGASATHAASK